MSLILSFERITAADRSSVSGRYTLPGTCKIRFENPGKGAYRLLTSQGLRVSPDKAFTFFEDPQPLQHYAAMARLQDEGPNAGRRLRERRIRLHDPLVRFPDAMEEQDNRLRSSRKVHRHPDHRTVSFLEAPASSLCRCSGHPDGGRGPLLSALLCTTLCSPHPASTERHLHLPRGHD